MVGLLIGFIVLDRMFECKTGLGAFLVFVIWMMWVLG